MLRKLIIKPHTATPDATTGEIDIAAVATVLVTSEAPDHPIDLAFDDHRGPGGTRWIAGEPGEQTRDPCLRRPADDQPNPPGSRGVGSHLEPRNSSCVSLCDGGRTYRELLRQEFNFSPAGTTFEREKWTVSAQGVTHLRLVIKPDKGDKPCRATLTSLVLR